MRIISGKLKGKSINFLKNSTTRPLKDSVKENIFNILEHSNLIKIGIKDTSILDLYSGVGSFGLECISRGAKKATFVESDNIAVKVLRENLAKLGIANQTNLNNVKVENFLIKNNMEKYNIFFLDPPFVDQDFTKNLALIKKNKIFENKHIIIIHREHNVIDNLADYVNTLVVKNYGRSKIIFATFN